MKKWIALLLVLALCLGGCVPAKDNPLVGTWSGELDMTQAMNDMIAADETMARYVKLESFKLNVTMTFTQDGAYTMRVEETSVAAAVAGYAQAVEQGVKAMLEDQLAQAGLDVSVEEMLELTGMTMEEMLASLGVTAMDEAAVAQAAAQLSSQGRYEAVDGKLYTSDSLDAQPGEDAYESYTLSDGTLTLTEYVGPEGESTAMVYPIVLTRAE